MLLSQTDSNQKVEILSIGDSNLKINLLKLGIQEGDVVQVSHKVSRGPIILQHRSQEIAIGNENLKNIEVRHYDNQIN